MIFIALRCCEMRVCNHRIIFVTNYAQFLHFKENQSATKAKDSQMFPSQIISLI